MASVHNPDFEKMAPIFTESEKLAGGAGKPGEKALRQLMEEMRESGDFWASSDGDNKIDRSKNVADNATPGVVEYAAQYSISDIQLEDRMDEMIDTCCKCFVFAKIGMSTLLTLRISTTHRHQAITNQRWPATQDRLLSVALRQHAAHDADSGSSRVDLSRKCDPPDGVGWALSHAQLRLADCTPDNLRGNRQVPKDADLGRDI